MSSSQEIPIHDNFLVSYSVHCERREITLFTEYRDRGRPFEYTNVTFSGVVAYDFWQDSETGTIIFGLEEVDPNIIFNNNAERIAKGLNYGWPGEWAKNPETASSYFAQNHIKGFELHSSCGMDGWIFAKSMVHTAAPTPAAEPVA